MITLGLRRFGFVYFAHAPTIDLVKIGFSKHPLKRLKELAAEHFCSLVLEGVDPGPMYEERQAHWRFRRHATDGGEWFRAAPEVLSYARRLLPYFARSSAEYRGPYEPYVSRVTNHAWVDGEWRGAPDLSRRSA